MLGRRSLLRGLGGTAAAAPLLAGGEAAGEARPRWDRTVDVVVVGSGTGLCGALVAASHGLKVLVLEKSELIGGNTVVSGGVLWVPGNRIMARHGLSDSRDQALTYMRHLAQGQADPELLESFYDHGADMADFVEQATDLRWIVAGAEVTPPRPSDYHPTWAGSLPGRSLLSEAMAPGTHAAGGVRLIGALQAACEKKGVEILPATPAVRLITQAGPDGVEVAGVEAAPADAPGGAHLRIRATRGVLVASGGFERNWDMKRHFLRGPSPYTLGSETNTGDGIRMGMALGADLRNMNEVWGISVYKAEGERNGDVRAGISLNAQIERGNAGTLCVNRHGERFGNESADYDTSWRTYHTFENWLETGYRNIPAFLIADQAVRERATLAGARPGQTLPDYVVSADSLDALADRLGIDKAGLAATVARFNKFAAEGKDPDFHRGESGYDTLGGMRRPLAPLTKAPFYGIELSPADIGTCGGLRVNGKAQVVDVFGQPIRRLFASGNTTGVGGPGALYGGLGGTLGPAMTFAFIAGTGLAGLAPVAA